MSRIKAPIKVTTQEQDAEPVQAPDPANENTNELLELNKKHAFVIRNGSAVVMMFQKNPVGGHEEIHYLRPSDFRAKYANRPTLSFTTVGTPRMTPLGDLWLESPSRRQYDGLVFMPGKGHEIGGHYNLFRGWPVQAIEGNCSLFWSHVSENICAGDDSLFQFVRRWMAHAIQRPWEVPETALVMRGPQGTGKGRLAHWFGRLFGEYYRPITQMDHLFGKFNSHMMTAILVFADEMTWGGNKQNEGLLLSMITDDMLAVECKGQDMAGHHKNYRRFIFASNDDWPIAMGPRDRRFVIFDVSDAHQQDHTYFNALNEQMERGGLQALMHDLVHMDLTGFNPRKKPAGGKAAIDIIERSLKPTAKFWIEHVRGFDDEHSWPSVVDKHGLHTYFLAWCKSNLKSHPDGLAEFSKKLKDLAGWEKTSPRSKSQDGGFAVGSPPRLQQWKMLSLDETRKRCQDYLGVGPELWD